jgi:excisionase family DNA binding protein
MESHTLLFKLSPEELRGLIKEELEKVLNPSVQKEPSIDELISIDEACTFLKISRPTLRKLTQSGKIPYQKLGRTIRYNKSELVNLKNK